VGISDKSIFINQQEGTMAKYDVVVIGAGNGGLTAAAKLAQSGIKVLLLEKHNIPGGCATSFCRGRFEFEVALHQLTSLGPPEKPGLLRMELDKMGVMDDLEFVEMSDLYHVATPEGFNITLKTDRDQTIAILKENFPHEKDAIQEYFDLMATFANETVAAFIFRDPEPSRDKYPNLYKYALRNSKEILDDYFSDPLLKTVLSVYWGYIGVPPSRLAFTYLAMIFFQNFEFKPYHIKGGSQALSNAILNKFLSNGGTARFNCAANKITIEDGRITGVVTDEGDEVMTNYVVCNASPIATYTYLMDPEQVPADAHAGMKGCNLSTSAFTMFI
jgi:prolycopene isomerase